MPETSGVVVSTIGMGMSPQSEFSKHYFLGANTFMLDILNSNKTELGITANNFDTVIQRTKDFIKTSASLEINSTSLVAGSWILL